MRARGVLLFGLVLLAGFAQPTVEDALPAFSKAYDVVFRRLQSLELTDTETRIRRLGARGKAFQPTLDGLRRGQGEVSDLMVKAIEMKKKAVLDKKPEAIEAATRLLVEDDSKAQRLHVDLARLNEKLTAAGAPPAEVRPPRDPNARD